jgi:hypothetical protein
MRTSFHHQSEAQPPNGPLTAEAKLLRGGRQADSGQRNGNQERKSDCERYEKPPNSFDCILGQLRPRQKQGHDPFSTHASVEPAGLV